MLAMLDTWSEYLSEGLADEVDMREIDPVDDRIVPPVSLTHVQS